MEEIIKKSQELPSSFNARCFEDQMRPIMLSLVSGKKLTSEVFKKIAGFIKLGLNYLDKGWEKSGSPLSDIDKALIQTEINNFSLKEELNKLKSKVETYGLQVTTIKPSSSASSLSEWAEPPPSIKTRTPQSRTSDTFFPRLVVARNK